MRSRAASSRPIIAPFDRLLMARAREDDLTLVTADAQIRRYEVKTLDASI